MSPTPGSPRGERPGRPGSTAALLALVDRAERGALLPAEADLLRAGIQALATASSRHTPTEGA